MKRRLFYTLALVFVTVMASAQTTVTYSYDKLNRLTEVNYSSGIKVTYTYDELGNRTSKTVTTSSPGGGSLRGDVDGDGRVTITDVTVLIDYLLSGNTSGISLENADCDQDGRVTITDVTTLIDYLLKGDDRSLIFSKTLNGTEYKLYKRIINENDKRANGDGTVFYRTELSLDVANGSTTKTAVLGDDIYHTKEQRDIAMLFDLRSNHLFVFTNSKAEDQYYGMDGFNYTSSLGDLSFNKEVVFTSKNWGWWPYYEYTDGQVYLYHFSYVSYFAVMSVRNDNGTWSSYSAGSISPDEFRQIWEQKDLVLVVE